MPERITEKNISGKVEVREETATLKKVLLWRPGAEAALAQLLPEKLSCFFDEFNVLEARKEFDELTTLYKKALPNVTIIQTKDLYAEMLRAKAEEPVMNLDQLIDKANTKADSYYNNYKDRIKRDLNVIKNCIYECIMDDVNKYGEKAAILMNDRLLDPPSEKRYPLANIIYMRDQSNLIGTTLVWSSMKYDIRQPEVELIKEILTFHNLFGPEINQVQVTGQGRFEGGDAIVTNGTAYIGVGGRTNLEGIRQIAPYIIAEGLELIVVYDENRANDLDGEMEAMHYDTIGMPVTTKEMVACLDEFRRRDAYRVVLDSDNNIRFVNLGNFAVFMKEGKKQKFIEITTNEQRNHAPNFVNLGGRRILLSKSHSELTRKLEDSHIKIYDARLTEITKGYGGAHCMSGTIWRG